MDSSSTQNGRDLMAPKHNCDSTILLSAARYRSPRRTPSSSSSSSSSSSLGSLYFSEDSSPRSPASPLRFSGVPFSWEHLPGVPKNKLQCLKKKNSMKMLPLPPPATPPTTKKNSFEARRKAAADSFRKDPFFAAMVECSKDDNEEESGSSNLWTGLKVTRTISDRFGFINLYSSCKNTCAVSESVVYLPRPSRTPNYGLISRRSRQM